MTSPTIDFALTVESVSLESRMKSAYLDYAMSVIIGRALPDVRDGLKPVHRRTLFAMHETGNTHNKPFKKSARIVGDVMGKYHPHGGEAIYDALVRLAQDFSMRETLVEGQGNFGSIDGDNAAAMRYTEVRMAAVSEFLLQDIEKETVDFTPNYDGAEMEPTVLPARFPNLLVNGASGIAVGMATNIPPHNLSEVIDVTLMLLKNPKATVDDLIKFMPAPDFPTGAFIHGLGGARDAYRTGRGRIVMRAKTHFEDLDKSGRQAIVIDEIPYQVNKALLVENIAELVRDKKIEGISDLRDESDRNGIRVVIELRRHENAEVKLNNLFKETQLQTSFSVNLVALADGAPHLMNLCEVLDHFLAHRREVVVRRTRFELEKARVRAHLLEGLAVAVSNMDEIINLIKSSKSPAEAEEKLMTHTWRGGEVFSLLASFNDLSMTRPKEAESGRGWQDKGKKYLFYRAQVKAILEMRLSRLTAMERDKIVVDFKGVVALIDELMALLADPERIKTVIADELKALKKKFSSPRRSIIVENDADIDIEGLIAEEEMAVTFSYGGYVKRQPISDYNTQRRGGRGKVATTTREGDFINRLCIASTHDYLLIFTNRGRVYWKKVYELPLASRASRGRPIIGVLSLNEQEKVEAVLNVRYFDCGGSVVMCTANGTIKKTPLEAFSRPRKDGIIAIKLDENDSLINASLANDDNLILLFSDAGKAISFDATKIRNMGRVSRGVRGMALKPKQQVVSMLVLPSQEVKSCAILVATKKGQGKRTAVSNFRITNRGGQGVIALRLKDDDALIGVVIASDEDELMLITNAGVLQRTNMKEIRRLGRATMGVRLIKPDKGTYLAGIARIADSGEEE